MELVGIAKWTSTYQPSTASQAAPRQMAAVLDGFELLEIAALDTANGNRARLAEVVQRTPQVVDEMEIAMMQSLGDCLVTGCDWRIFGILQIPWF